MNFFKSTCSQLCKFMGMSIPYGLSFLRKCDEKKIKTLSLELIKEREKSDNALADYNNLKERTSKSLASSKSDGAREFVENLLPALDSLNKAVEFFDKGDFTKEEGAKGLKIFSDQINNILKKEGLEKIDAVGKPFDTRYHEAVSKQFVEGKAEDEILCECETGYIFRGSVIRFSKVTVNKHK